MLLQNIMRAKKIFFSFPKFLHIIKAKAGPNSLIKFEMIWKSIADFFYSIYSREMPHYQVYLHVPGSVHVMLPSSATWWLLTRFMGNTTDVTPSFV